MRSSEEHLLAALRTHLSCAARVRGLPPRPLLKTLEATECSAT
jgi:hypothetical protein